MHRRVQVEVAWFIALSDAKFAEFKPLTPGARNVLAGPGRQLLRSRRRRHQGNREDHQPRREGRRILDQVQVRGQPGAARAPASLCTSPAPARTSTTPATRCRSRRRATRCCCPPIDGLIATLRDMAAPVRRRVDAVAHPRPDRQPDHGRQGNRQRRGAPGQGARSDRRRAAAGQDERRRGQLQRPPGRLARLRLGSLQPQGDRDAGAAGPGPGLPALQHPDRAARLHGRAVRRRGPRQHHPDRLLARHLGLREPGLLQAAPEDGRDRLVDHAAQGQPDRLRERRRQPGPGERAAAPPEREAAHQPLAARPDRQHRAAQHRRGLRLRRRWPTRAWRPAWASSSSTRKRSPTTSTPRGKCWPSRSRP